MLDVVEPIPQRKPGSMRRREFNLPRGCSNQNEIAVGVAKVVQMLDQADNKHQSVTPSSSGRRKISCKTAVDAIVDVMLEIAAPSKMRASAIMKNEERFSISRCIKVLDEMQGVDQRIYFLALDLFENPNAREIFISLKREKRLLWLQGKCSVSSG
ncbi:hypothetical protein EZV62_015178 [Acer yangbiense]|uniref:Uncharacterized protein n=1 Tax=Acer yangbiense TaxID=1000413 RepID=A0A5C7HUN9_9ROSI|nr:hypothetical protein EZV62_015178 [Acer yangbiense]